MGLTGAQKNLRDFLQVLVSARHPHVPPLPHWDEGPDDLWPPDSDAAERLVETLAETPSEPELIVTKQWGLRLPGGHISWNSFQGVPFDNPLDRVHMIAKLEQTAADIGFAAEDFLGRYGWVTRNQIAAVVYEDTGAYPLADQEVCRQDQIPSEENQS